MPLYEYRCPECGIQREVEHPMTHSETVMCMPCNASMNKIFVPIANINVKGMSAR